MRLLLGDCIERMRDLPEGSVDAVVTDPPYGIGFMGKQWDDLPPGLEFAAEALRVLKPGGHLLAFGGTRTYHRLACALEDAGFEIRDCIAWMYGSGFPKSLDVSKAIDKRGGNPHLAHEIAAAIRTEREVRGLSVGECDRHFCGGSTNWTWFEGRKGDCRPPTPETFARIVAEWPELASLAAKVAEADRDKIGEGVSGIGTAFGEGEWSGEGAEVYDITAPATPDAERWQGWGTALKPAFEPIVVARKPLIGTVAANVLRFGTGALNVGGCRIEGVPPSKPQPDFSQVNGERTHLDAHARNGEMSEASGRWPANVVLDEEAAAILDEQTGELPRAGGKPPRRNVGSDGRVAFGSGWEGREALEGAGPLDEGGGASRFFYCAKVSRAERNAGLDGFEAGVDKASASAHSTVCAKCNRQRVNVSGACECPDPEWVRVQQVAQRNIHPTVKPIALMRWLVRLVTPPGGTVLDPFLGSGTTGCAAVLEGFDFVGIERDPDYLRIAEARVGFWAEYGEHGLAIVAAREAAEAKRAAVAEAGQLDLFAG